MGSDGQKVGGRIQTLRLGSRINPSLLIPSSQLGALLSIPIARGLGETLPSLHMVFLRFGAKAGEAEDAGS